MISFIFEFLTRGIVFFIKSIFEMISFFIRLLLGALRLFVSVLPVTGIAYSVFFIILAIELFAGDELLTELTPLNVDSSPVKKLIYDSAKGYLGLMSEYSGTLLYFVLFFIMLILIIPLILTFVGVGTFVFAGKYLIYPALADLFLYVIGGIITNRSPFDMISARYRFLFPGSGRKS